MSDPGDPRDSDDANDSHRAPVDSPDGESRDGAEAPDAVSSDGPTESGEPPDGAPAEPADDRPSRSDDEGGQNERRRWRSLLFLLLLLLVLVGGGIGTFVIEDQGNVMPGIQFPTESPAPTSTPGATGDLSLTADANATLLRAEGVAPGDGGVSRLPLRNDGTAAGELAVVSLTVTSEENGITNAEASADDSPAEGELAESLLVRLSVRYSGGETVRVLGGGGFVPLAGAEARNRTIGSSPRARR
ncbi:hypothetical protein ACFQL4_14020 [Halosimplex aquaticum]